MQSNNNNNKEHTKKKLHNSDWTKLSNTQEDEKGTTLTDADITKHNKSDLSKRIIK